MYYRINLSQGLYAIIDKEDEDRVNKHKWCAVFQTNSNNYYAYSMIDGKHCSLSHFILNHDPKKTKGKFVVDHINRNPLDNRKCNLRIVSIRQNNINKNKQKNNKSGIVGVSHDKKNFKYIAYWSEGVRKRKQQSFVYGKENKDNIHAKKIAKKKAKNYRKEMIKNIQDYSEALLLDKHDSFSESDDELENIEICNRVKTANRNNKTRHIGVYYRGSKTRKPCFVAHWYVNGKQKTKTFTIGTKLNHTYEKALENAINYRKKMEIKYGII